jgi:hypothetical protein
MDVKGVWTMRPLSCATLGVLIILGSGASARANAITLQLKFFGRAYGTSFEKTVDVTHGVDQVSIPVGSMMSIHNMPPIGQPQAISSELYAYGTLLVDTGGSSSPKEAAAFDLLIPIHGSYIRMDQTEDLSGTVSGTASADFRPGADFSILPPWASTITGSVTGSIQGGYMNDLETTLTLSAQPVPEPTTLGFFLLALTGIGLCRVRARRPA